MGDQTKSIQNLSTERSIEHNKHNQLDIKGITSIILQKNLNNNEIKSRE